MMTHRERLDLIPAAKRPRPTLAHADAEWNLEPLRMWAKSQRESYLSGKWEILEEVRDHLGDGRAL
jgi:hypothetical protein